MSQMKQVHHTGSAGSRRRKSKCVSYATWETKDDNKPYNNGGLGRCSEENAVSKIKCSMDFKIKDEANKYHAAAK